MHETKTGSNGRATVRMVMTLCVAYLILAVLACRDPQVQEPEETAIKQPVRGSFESASDSTSPRLKETAIKQLVRDLNEHHDVTVSVTTGTEHFGKGLVKLSVRGDGSVTVQNRASGKERTFTGKLDTDELAALGPELAAAGFTTLRTPGPPRKPGDTPVVLGVAQGGKERYRADLWYGDRYQMPGLDRIIKRHDAIVTKLTNGELPY